MAFQANGNIFLIDELHNRKLTKELKEIGLDDTIELSISDLLELTAAKLSTDDSVIAFISEDQVKAFNDWLVRACPIEKCDKLIYQIKPAPDPGFVPNLSWELFNTAFNFNDRFYDDIRVTALEIKKALGLVPEIPDWDTYFMSLVYLAAMRSRDANTHMGAVIVRPDNTIVSTGYNSFPRGIKDDKFERQIRPEKYFWFNHAEYNAIINARTDLTGCRMYTNGIPCMERCAGAIINSGIKEVIIDGNWDTASGEKWQQQGLATKDAFFEAGIKLRFWNGEIIPKIERYRCGKLF